MAQQVFIARQPIFDRTSERVAYELLYRASGEATGAVSNLPASVMCGDTALAALLSIGLEKLTGGVRAFVNVTEDHLVGEWYRIFDAGMVVLELLETIEATAAVVEACERAVANGYVLALDDYDGRSSLDPLLPLVSIVKVDILPKAQAAVLGGLAPTVSRLKSVGLKVLAERVETIEQLEECREMGFDLYQGYVFSRPETFDGRTASVHQPAVFQIVSMLREPRATDRELEDAFRSHPSLSLMLLRIVNSASFGGRGVDSIGYAVRLVGREALSRWMMVLLVATVGSRSAVAHEAVMMALVRARFCEIMSEQVGYANPGTRFLVGLLSTMDRLLGIPMEQVLERLPVSDDVRDALLWSRGPHSDVIRFAAAYEKADWDFVEGASPGMRTVLSDLYTESLTWAAERLSSVTPRGRHRTGRYAEAQ